MIIKKLECTKSETKMKQNLYSETLIYFIGGTR